MKRIDNELINTKNKTNEIIAKVLEGEKQFQEKQESFKKQITQFQKFIVDSDRKRAHKLKQIEEERKQTALKQQEIIEKKAQLKKLKAESKQFHNELQSLRRYQNYLNQVANQNENYSIVDELLQRYEILVDTHKSLQKTVAEYSQRIEHYSSKLSKYVKDKQNELLVKNSQLARCLKMLDDAISEKQMLEESLYKHHLKDQETKRSINQVKLAIINLYDRIYQTYSIKKPSYKYQKPTANTNPKSSDNTSGTINSYLDNEKQYGILLQDVSQRIVDLMDIVYTFQKESQMLP